MAAQKSTSVSLVCIVNARLEDDEFAWRFRLRRRPRRRATSPAAFRSRRTHHRQRTRLSRVWPAPRSPGRDGSTGSDIELPHGNAQDHEIHQRLVRRGTEDVHRFHIVVLWSILDDLMPGEAMEPDEVFTRSQAPIREDTRSESAAAQPMPTDASSLTFPSSRPAMAPAGAGALAVVDPRLYAVGMSSSLPSFGPLSCERGRGNVARNDRRGVELMGRRVVRLAATPTMWPAARGSTLWPSRSERRWATSTSW